MPWVVSSGDHACARVDDNRPGVFARRRAWRDSIRWSAGGSGAGPGFDGADVVQTHMTNSRLTDPEVLEWRFPVRLESFEIRRGSGGRGRWRGGEGAVRRVRFLEAMTAAILSGHRKVRPHGMAGGEPGLPGHNFVERVNGGRSELGPFDQAEMAAGDVFVIESPGGGGYAPA